jgi:16S rRNA (uracil1498-N3)-methyltransferase
MESLYATPEWRQGDQIVLPPEEAHHALRVRRIRPGEEMIVVDGEGGWCRTVAEGAAMHERGGRGAPTLRVRILEERHEVGEPPWRLTIAQGVGKGRKFDFVVEKATELGAAAFIPLSTDREIVPMRSPGALTRHERWRRIAVAAMKQCGRSRLPDIEMPQSMHELAPRFKDFDLALVAWEHEELTTIPAALRAAEIAPGTPCRILIMVGPEGGFTSNEIETAIEAGAVMVTLGERRLRTETAGFVVAALVGASLDASSLPANHLLGGA